MYRKNRVIIIPLCGIIFMGKTKLIISINRAVKILELFAQGINRLEDIYPMIGLSKSTTHRLLKSLVSAGLAFQSPINRYYYIGHKFLRLASNPVVSHQMLVICAYKELERLQDLSGETSLVSVQSGINRLVVKEIPSRKKIAFFSGVGTVEPIYIGSSGKLLLSHLEEKDLEILLRSIDLRPIGPNTITNFDILRKEIKKIRNKSYATSRGESLPGAVGISVPVKNYICPVALSIFGPEFRFSPENFLEEMRKSSNQISKKLSYLQAKTS